LILSNAQARWHGAPASLGGASQEAFHGLARSNWRMASMALAETFLGNSFDAGALQWLLRIWREAVAPEIFDQLMVAHVYNTDMRELLPKVGAPTLVVHYRDNGSIPFEAGRELAAGIPGAGSRCGW
jgi:pimeloyl-ACP methyl ester carboxylesterase